MPELRIEIPSTFVERIERLAAEESESLEDMAMLLLRRGYDFEVTKPEVEPDRSQRPGARGDARLDWWREARFGLSFTGGCTRYRRVCGTGATGRASRSG